MTLNRVLPSLQHLVIILLFRTDASLVLDLGEFSGTLLVHAVLEVTTHCAITLTHLAQDIRLVRLLVECSGQSLLLVGRILSRDLTFDHLLIVVPEPFSLLLDLLLEKNVSFAVLVHILQQVDTGLILASPLLLAVVPLLLILYLGQLINVALVGSLVRRLLVVVLLELLNLATAGHALS